MLSISLAGFCINDIFDQELDRINHPDRALAQYPALSHAVAAIYVSLFVISIGLVFIQEGATRRFLWTVFFLLLSNYTFFKHSFPLVKNVYVSLTACTVIAILDLAHDLEISSVFLYVPFIVAVIAREIACDIPDIAGDKGTLAQKLGKRQSTLLVVTLYLTSLAATIFLSETSVQIAIASIGAVSFGGYVVARNILSFQEKHLLPLSGISMISPVILIIN